MFKIFAKSKIIGSWGKYICHLGAPDKVSSPFIPVGIRLPCSQRRNDTLSSWYVCFTSTSHSWGFTVTSYIFRSSVQGPFKTRKVVHWCFLHESTEPGLLCLWRRQLPSEWCSPRAFSVNDSEIKPRTVRNVPEPLHFHSGCHPNQSTR